MPCVKSMGPSAQVELMALCLDCRVKHHILAMPVAHLLNELSDRERAGVKVINLAESLGFERLYYSIYRITSGGVHATDATEHISLDDDPKPNAVSGPPRVRTGSLTR
jgi:hypothetical protein